MDAGSRQARMALFRDVQHNALHSAGETSARLNSITLVAAVLVGVIGSSFSLLRFVQPLAGKILWLISLCIFALFGIIIPACLQWYGTVTVNCIVRPCVSCLQAS